MNSLKNFIAFSLMIFFSCIEKDKSDTNDEVASLSSVDTIPIEYRQCLLERATEDSLLMTFFKSVNENWNDHSNSFNNPGCLSSIKIDDSNAKKIVNVLINEISDKSKGKAYRSALLFDLRSISCHNVRPPYYKKGLIVFDGDSVEAYIINGWKEWWKNTKHLSYYEWNLQALRQKNNSKYSTYTAISNLRKYGDKRVIPHFIEKIDTTIFNSHQNYNASLVDALVELKAIEIIPYIIKYYLNASPEYLRKDGIKYLSQITGKTLDYKPLSSKKMRMEAINRWWKYWDGLNKDVKNFKK